MATGKGWFENDADYRRRIAREDAEATVRGASGSAPARRLLESSSDYHARIVGEANAERLRAGTGSPARRGWIESEQAYHRRVEREANEAALRQASGSSPSRGVFESDARYESRVREEANAATIAEATGSLPQRGFIESEHDYRSRLAHEAREARLRKKKERRTQDTSSSSSGIGDFLGCSMTVWIIAVCLTAIFGGSTKDAPKEDASEAPKAASAPVVFENPLLGREFTDRRPGVRAGSEDARTAEERSEVFQGIISRMQAPAPELSFPEKENPAPLQTMDGKGVCARCGATITFANRSPPDTFTCPHCGTSNRARSLPPSVAIRCSRCRQVTDLPGSEPPSEFRCPHCGALGHTRRR